MARIAKKIIDALLSEDEAVNSVENVVAETYTQDGDLVGSYETLGEANAAALESGENLVVKMV